MKKYIIFLVCGLTMSNVISAQSPYIDRVFDYSPAPGQFINTMPQYEEGDTHDTMTQKADDALSNNKRTMICLGGFGGSVTFGFDHEIPNIEGEYDFQILGNAMLSGNAQDGRAGGSAEPGIILVATDENNNGLPDDTWYEIAGSEYNKIGTKHNYTITYYRTSANHQPTPSLINKTLTDTTYIEWHDSDGSKGYLTKNTYHLQDYYPQWIAADSLSFTGTLLANNAEWQPENSIYILYCFDYGYADNYPNNNEQSKINIDWAVDDEGNPANLQSIKFVKIYSGLNQSCGWIGETSTEVMGANDLHFTTQIAYNTTESNSTKQTIYNLQGQRVDSDFNNLPSGIYLIVSDNGIARKIVK